MDVGEDPEGEGGEPGEGGGDRYDAGVEFGLGGVLVGLCGGLDEAAAEEVGSEDSDEVEGDDDDAGVHWGGAL